MFKIKKTKIIAKNAKKYLSFPDILQSKKDKNTLFLVYRSGEFQHPVQSKLVFMISKDKGETWRIKQEFFLSLKKHGYVWNCPRLSYIDDDLYIICDQKNGTYERKAHFKISFLKSIDDGDSFEYIETPMPGMVPDKIIKFKNKLFCANHKIKLNRNGLIQLISWSKDNGKLWYDTNILANDDQIKYCEASLVNVNNKYLIAYLRDNSGHQKYIYYSRSIDGIIWTKPKQLNNIIGQRVTAIKDKNMILGTYRNTEEVKLSLFYHPVNKENKVQKIDIDEETYPENLYHFGYSGLIKIDDKRYITTYYIKNNEVNPYIKVAFFNRF